MVKSRNPKIMNKARTNLTLQGEDAQLLDNLKLFIEQKYNYKLPLIEVVRKALRELDRFERNN